MRIDRRSLYRGITALFAVSALYVGQGGSAQTPALSTALAPEARDGVESVGAGEARRDFGTINPLDTQRLDQIFYLRNSSSEAVTIDYLRPSCGCTSGLLLTGHGATDGHTVLASGADIGVRVNLTADHIKPGRFSQFVLVYLKGSTAPAARLEMTGMLQSPVVFSPATTDFGQISAGREATLILSVSVDRRLMARDDAALPLLCTNPDVHIAAAPPEPGAAATASCVTRRYILTLPAATRLGSVNGSLHFMPLGPRPAALASISAPIYGDVLGHIQALPLIVVFGSVTVGQQASQQITLTGQTPDELKNLKIDCSTPLLSARLLPTAGVSAAASPASSTATIEIRLDAKTPPGGLQAELRITTARGEHLVLPVIGAVLAATGAR